MLHMYHSYSYGELGFLVIVLLPSAGLLFWLFNVWCMGKFKWQRHIPTIRQKMLVLWGLVLILLLLALAARTLL